MPSSLLLVADLAVARGVAVVVAALPSSIRLASLSMEMKRSGEEKQAADKRGERRGTALVELAAGLAIVGVERLSWRGKC